MHLIYVFESEQLNQMFQDLAIRLILPSDLYLFSHDTRFLDSTQYGNYMFFSWYLMIFGILGISKDFYPHN